MDEQKLNEAAEKYAGISEDKFANSAKKYDAYDMADAFSSGARWHEQQNPWRKIQDELPKVEKRVVSRIGNEKNVKLSSKKLFVIHHNKIETAFFCHGFNFSGNYSIFLDQNGSHIFNVTEWKYID